MICKAKVDDIQSTIKRDIPTKPQQLITDIINVESQPILTSTSSSIFVYSEPETRPRSTSKCERYL